MKWMITGGRGMLARDLSASLSALGETPAALSRAEFDVTDPVAARDLFQRYSPDIIVNCAAFTRVDDCETESEEAENINARAVEVLADEARRSGALLIQISTDFVFDGTKTSPYQVTDVPNPLSQYGSSKLRGEYAAATSPAHVIIRTSWLFGVHGNNFVEAIRRQIRAGKSELTVVADQRGRPTYTPHLSEAVIALATRACKEESARGVFHYADEDECSWFDFAKAIVEEETALNPPSQPVVVRPSSSRDFPRPAVRPAYSVMSTERYTEVTGNEPYRWREGLSEYFRLRP